MTRNSSCVNARGIPTAAYQVLRMLSPIPGGTGVLLWGTPSPVLTWLGGTYLGWGGRYLSPRLDMAGVPPSPRLDLARGYLPWLGVGTYPLPSGSGVPYPSVNRLKTLPSPILRMRSVKITVLTLIQARTVDT